MAFGSKWGLRLALVAHLSLQEVVNLGLSGANGLAMSGLPKEFYCVVLAVLFNIIWFARNVKSHKRNFSVT